MGSSPTLGENIFWCVHKFGYPHAHFLQHFSSFPTKEADYSFLVLFQQTNIYIYVCIYIYIKKNVLATRFSARKYESLETCELFYPQGIFLGMPLNRYTLVFWSGTASWVLRGELCAHQHLVQRMKGIPPCSRTVGQHIPRTRSQNTFFLSFKKNHDSFHVDFCLGVPTRLSSNPCTALGTWALHLEDFSQTTVYLTE